MNLPQKRIRDSFQIVIPQLIGLDKLFSDRDKEELVKIIQKETNLNVKKLKFEGYGVGRGAGNPALGLDVTSLLDTLSKIKDFMDLVAISINLVENIRKKFGKKRKIIYSRQFIESYCIGKILMNTKEEKLKRYDFIDIIGNGYEQYEYIDYYFFRFIGNSGSYLVLADSSASIVECKLINFEGAKEIELKK